MLAQQGRCVGERGGTAGPKDQAQPEDSDNNRDEEHCERGGYGESDIPTRKRVTSHGAVVGRVGVGSKRKACFVLAIEPSEVRSLQACAPP